MDSGGMTKEQISRFWEFVFSDDMAYYEKYIMPLPIEEQEAFLREHQDIFSLSEAQEEEIVAHKEKVLKAVLEKIGHK